MPGEVGSNCSSVRPGLLVGQGVATVPELNPGVLGLSERCPWRSHRPMGSPGDVAFCKARHAKVVSRTENLATRAEPLLLIQANGQLPISG